MNKKTLYKNKILIIMMIVAIAVIAVLFVSLNAISAQLQYEINIINAEIQTTNYKIANLQVKIKNATSISVLEQEALDLGLVYPEYDDFVFISGGSQIQDFSTALRNNAYNK